MENRLYILGWAKSNPEGPVYGVELELMTLLSRLITGLPAEEAGEVVYALKDDSGRILHQIGTSQIDLKTEPESEVSLAPQLPHWELAVYTRGNIASPLNGRGFLGRKESGEIRACAALGLGKMRTPEAMAALQKAQDEKDPVVRSAVNRALKGEV